MSDQGRDEAFEKIIKGLRTERDELAKKLEQADFSRNLLIVEANRIRSAWDLSVGEPLRQELSSLKEKIEKASSTIKLLLGHLPDSKLFTYCWDECMGDEQELVKKAREVGRQTLTEITKEEK